MKKISSLFLLLLPGFVLNAQNVLSTLQLFPELKYSELIGTIYYKTYTQVRGSAFLDDNYLTGKIFLQNGKVIEDVKMKFDLYANEIIVYHDVKRQLVIVDKNIVKGFEMNTVAGIQAFVRLQNVNTNTMSKYGSYVMALCEGKYSLYKLQYKKQIALQNLQDNIFYEFDDEIEYHLFIEGQDVKIKLRRSVLKKLYPTLKVDIRKFMHQEKIKPRTEAGFVKIIEFINKL